MHVDDSKSSKCMSVGYGMKSVGIDFEVTKVESSLKVKDIMFNEFVMHKDKNSI